MPPYPSTLGALLREVALVAGHTDDLLVPRDEALVADGFCAHHAREALLVPLFPLVLKLLHTCNMAEITCTWIA